MGLVVGDRLSYGLLEFELESLQVRMAPQGDRWPDPTTCHP